MFLGDNDILIFRKEFGCPILLPWQINNWAKADKNSHVLTWLDNLTWLLKRPLQCI